LVNGQMQGSTQFRVTNEQQSAEGLAVHFGGEQQAVSLLGL
jgi:hypothetical protein